MADCLNDRVDGLVGVTGFNRLQFHGFSVLFFANFTGLGS